MKIKDKKPKPTVVKIFNSKGEYLDEFFHTGTDREAQLIAIKRFKNHKNLKLEFRRF